MGPDVFGRGADRSLGLPALFVVITGLLLAALAWLAWRQIEVERGVDAERRRDHLLSAAAVLSDDLERQFAAWERMISDASSGDSVTTAPTDAALVYFDSTGVTGAAGVPLPFHPAVPATSDVVDRAIEAAEAMEYGRQGPAAAEQAYRTLSSSSDSRVRAAALVRLARALRAQGKMAQALAAYGELAALGDVPIFGVPAELIVHQARSTVLGQINDDAGSARERDRLAAALWAGRHRIDRATFEAIRLSAAPRHDPVALEMADAVEAFWSDWQSQPAGRRVRTVADQAWVATWHPVPGRHGALVAPAGPLRAALARRAASLGIDVALIDPADVSTGVTTTATPDTANVITRPARETGLPWALRVTAPDDAGTLGVRGRVLIVGFGLMTLVIASSGYFVFRAVNREIGVAQLQSDFLAAVSHEFRSPLTAMGHLTEMLEDGHADPARLPTYYQALGRETRRLHGLVESLLDFGRTEAGGRTYAMTDVDLVAVVREVVGGIEAADAAMGSRIVVAAPSASESVSADAAALSVVVRNLIDNALKYSPAPAPVRVGVTSTPANVTLTVEDDGPGLSAQEQREVFRKFVRGAAARDLNVKGTGIGLTMAKHIVAAHGGVITLESAPGTGTRFTVVLPARR